MRWPAADLLAIVEEQIGLGHACINAQRCVIERMRRKGDACVEAEAHLTILEATLASHLIERERLQAEMRGGVRSSGAS